MTVMTIRCRDFNETYWAAVIDDNKISDGNDMLTVYPVATKDAVKCSTSTWYTTGEGEDVTFSNFLRMSTYTATGEVTIREKVRQTFLVTIDSYEDKEVNADKLVELIANNHNLRCLDYGQELDEGPVNQTAALIVKVD